MRAVVIGAGVGGLAAAIALGRMGWQVRVLERAARPEDTGAGIQLTPNAMKCLRALGADDALGPALSFPERYVVADALAGRVLAMVPLGRATAAAYGAPYGVIRRSDLVAGLLRAASAQSNFRVEWSTEAEAVRETDGGCAVMVGPREFGGREVEADLVVASDGVHSPVRRRVFNREAGRATGAVAWRRMLTGDDHTIADPEIHFLRGAHCVAYPLSGATTNVVLVDHEGARTPEELLAPARTLARLRGEPGAWQAWPVLENDLAGAWTTGRVALLGDAAHALLPSAAQGGAMALEDAVVLAASLRRSHGIAEALRAYADARRPRVEMIRKLSRRNLAIWGAGGVMRLGRNAALFAAGRLLVRRSFDRVFRWSPPA